MKLSAVLAAVLLCVFIAETEASVRAWPKDDPVRIPDTGLKGDELDCADIDTITFASLPLTEYRSGTNVGADNNTEAYSCEEWREDGGEVVYQVILDQQTLLSAQVTPEDGVDLDIFLLNDCHSDYCLIGASTAFSISVDAGAYWIVIDGYHGDEGAFDLAVEARSTGVPDIVCDELAETIPIRMEAWNDTASLYERENLLHSYDCSTTPEAGGEAWYHCALPAGTSFEADARAEFADAALWLLIACDGVTEPALCVDFSDATASGGRETVTWTNDTDAEASLVLAVDSYTPPPGENAGSFILETTISRYEPICDVADPDLVEVLAAPGATAINGDLSTATAATFWADCLDTELEGAVAWYRVTVPAGTADASLTLGSMAFDGALLRFDGCTAAATCARDDYCADVGGEGIDETLVFSNTTAVETAFYLAVVSRSPAPGAYTLGWGAFTPTQKTTQGALRRRFR